MAQFPLLGTPFGLPQFPPSQHILNQQTVQHDAQQLHQQHQHFPMQALINNFNTAIPNPNINIVTQSGNFNGGFTRPFAIRPTAQLRRASSASMESNKATGMNGQKGSSAMLGGTRPASLQHHELLFSGDQQRMTPLPRKFEPSESILVEEEKTPQEQKMTLLVEQPERSGAAVHQSASLDLAQSTESNTPQTLRRNNSLSIGPSNNFSAQSSPKAPQSALPTLGTYQMFSNSTANGQATGALQQANNNVDSNVTLWQFLLELLAANTHPNLIQWTNNEGEFKLHDAEAVARLWGIRKGKPNMNYDKLSRALRYYYDKNIIKKVIGQKFVYRFVMDGKQSAVTGADGALGLGTPGNPELVLYAMSKAGLNVNGQQGQQKNSGDNRFEHNLTLHHPTTNSFPAGRPSPSCSSVAESSKSTASMSALNPNAAASHRVPNGALNTLTPSPANSSCSPTGSVESSSGVSSGSGMSSFAVPNGGAHFNGLGMVHVKSEPGLPNGSGQHTAGPSTSNGGFQSAEKARATRKRKSPLEQQQVGQFGNADGAAGACGTSSQRQSQDDASAPKIGCNSNTGPTLSRRARPQPLDLTSVNNSSTNSVSHLAGQMSQMVASSPLLYALQQHHHHQQQQQQSPLLSAAINALSNYAASPLASVASPLAQAAAFQLASNLVATLSPSLNTTTNGTANATTNGTAGIGGYSLPNSTVASTLAAAGNNFYNQLHSALTTPIASQVKTPQQQLSNSAMISAVINHLTNGGQPNTPFQQAQQQQQQAQQQQSLFQFPPSSNMTIAQTLAMLSSPGLPLAGQSPFPFMSQMAALQTPKFPANFQGASQRSPDSLKTPMGGLTFEFGQVMAASKK